MRLSLKWALAATAYVALAAAAIWQRSDLYAHTLWAIVIVTLCYAIALTVIARGESRAMACGFAAYAIVLALMEGRKFVDDIRGLRPESQVV